MLENINRFHSLDRLTSGRLSSYILCNLGLNIHCQINFTAAIFKLHTDIYCVLGIVRVTEFPIRWEFQSFMLPNL